MHYHKSLKDHTPTILRDNEVYKVLEGLITVTEVVDAPYRDQMGGLQLKGVTFSAPFFIVLTSLQWPPLHSGNSH